MRNNATLIGILVLIVAFNVWWFDLLGGGSGGEVKISPASEESGKALELVARIKAIEIDTSFLDDPEFLSLESVSPPSFDGFTRGRPNPFAKIVASPPPSPKQPPKR